MTKMDEQMNEDMDLDLEENEAGKKPHYITKIKDVKGLKLLVEFDGEDTRAIDLSKLVLQRPSFRRLKDPRIFTTYEIRNGGLAWSRDIEITGPTLYHMGDDSEAQSLS